MSDSDVQQITVQGVTLRCKKMGNSRARIYLSGRHPTVREQARKAVAQMNQVVKNADLSRDGNLTCRLRLSATGSNFWTRLSQVLELIAKTIKSHQQVPQPVTGNGRKRRRNVKKRPAGSEFPPKAR